MSDYLVSNIICFVLLSFFLITLHAIVYRWMFIRKMTEPCPGVTFYKLVLNEVGATNWSELFEHWNKRASHLGWVGVCMQEASASAALAKAEEIGREQDSYLQPLLLICNLSTLLGLFGTVGAFLVSADVNDVAFNTAFQSTALSILVSIPPALYLTFSHNARTRFDSQFDQFLTFVNQFSVQPQISTVASTLAQPNAKVTLPADLRASGAGKQRKNQPAVAQPATEFAGPDVVFGFERSHVKNQVDAESVARQVFEGGSL